MLSRKVILRALLCALVALVPFPDQENQLYDLKVRLLAKTQFERPGQVVVLEVSRDDFEALRKRYADLPTTSTDELGPWREKFESLRSQFYWDDQAFEGLLRKVLAELPRKLLITFFYGDSLVLLQNNSDLHRLARKPEVLWASQFDVDQKLLKPAAELTGTENYGYTNLHPDVDGVVRRAYLVHNNHMSLPFRALLDGENTLQRQLPLSEPFLIRYRGPPGFIPTCSVSDLIAAAPESSRCGSLKDRFVILSPAGNMGAGALYRTPLGFMSRGEVLANILLTAQSERPYLPVRKEMLFVFIFAHCLLFGIVMLTGGRSISLYLTLVVLGEALVSLLLMRFLDLQVPMVPFFIATAASFTTFILMRYSQQESKRWQAEKKNQYLRELDELKSNFLSLMSHDLKTPIAKVQALTERLAREARGLTDDQRGILEAIQRSNDELSQYILSILNFQRIESQELQLNRKNHDINQMIEDVIQRLGTLAQEKGIKVTLELEPMFPIEFDETLLRQVLSNLVDNSIKYNGPGTEVTVRSKDLHEFVEVSVEDNGVGIEKAQMERLFKKFSRSEKGTSERVKGTGLGLYLAKYFIELHGGEISAESEPGKGTRFQFRLPVK
jgi:two-component system, OmpR family, phosphate regulon sensor histidine kinase PhoR